MMGVHTVSVEARIAAESRDNTPALKVDAGDGGGEFTGLITPDPVDPGDYEGAFAKVYELAGLKAADYRIVDDTVRFSAWEQARRDPESGEFETVTLYSYRARFQRITELDRAGEALIARIHDDLAKRRRTNKRIPGTGLGPESDYTILPADWQFGKGETRPGDPGETAVEQTKLRIERAIDESKRIVKDLRRIGRNVTGITIGHMGDPIENVADSYTNQTGTITLNLNEQLNVALDCMATMATELLSLAERQTVFGVLCNHGQLARRGTKTNVTDDSDNAQNLLLQLLRDRIIGPAFPDCRWVLPKSSMIVTLDVAGVPVAAAHGQKMPGGESQRVKWFDSQTTNLTVKRGVTPRLWLTAHRHHDWRADMGAYTVFQCPTADGGSQSFEDGTARFSTPGTAALLIGEHNPRGWSDHVLI